MADLDTLDTFISGLQRRVDRLAADASSEAVASSPLVQRAFEEIQVALEALRVSEEELRVANEQLLNTQEEIALERQRYRDLFESAPEPYMVTDAAGVVRQINRAAASFLGVRQAVAVGKPLSVFVQEKERRAFRSFISRSAGEGSSRETQVTLTTRSHGDVPVAFRMEAVLDRHGEIAEFRCILHDLTQARDLEAERIARQEAERANRVKTDFLSTVSHELRTPLTTIMAYGEMLEMDIPEPLPPACRSSVVHINEASRHLLVLIDELLGFARVEAGRESVHRERFRLDPLLDDVSTFMVPLASKRGLTFACTAPPRPLELLTDRSKLQQILINLLANAVKFTESGQVRLEVESDKGTVSFHVQDSGVGIAPEHLKKIFDPFWQVPRGPEGGAGGTGLGLAICSRLTELMGGRLRVNSVIGAGTCFTLELPLDPD